LAAVVRLSQTVDIFFQCTFIYISKTTLEKSTIAA